jgi:hypothetical protein
MSRDFSRWDPHSNELCRDFSFRSSNVLRPKQELPIQIGHINGVHIDDVDVAKAHEGEIFQQLASETAGADDEDATHLPQEGQRFRRRFERRMIEGPFAREHFAQVGPALRLIEACRLAVHFHGVFLDGVKIFKFPMTFLVFFLNPDPGIAGVYFVFFVFFSKLRD